MGQIKQLHIDCDGVCKHQSTPCNGYGGASGSLDNALCPRCGGNEIGRKGPDAIDWCDDCGVIEGLLT